ncbi:uncharacterized protein LOC108034763 [Drosophila biarmipes]|uniref:uncharacterized protein LOC108034763 n=1 Tax=Drosophila biarmipes TaxID=125945 RepID=UPI0007E7FD7C|nr:uncharacterized protein LOC108034763 [Drosophila biarmipes]
MPPLSSDGCSLKDPTSVQIIVERTRESVSEIFGRYRRKVGDGARQAIQRARSRHRVDLIKKTSSHSIVDQYRFCTSFGCQEVASSVLLLIILLMLLLGLKLIRNYNHNFVYGSGGCLSTFLWTYEECIILT